MIYVSKFKASDFMLFVGQEMINNLTVSYNKARQSAITQELIEIVSGASAQK